MYKNSLRMACMGWTNIPQERTRRFSTMNKGLAGNYDNSPLCLYLTVQSLEGTGRKSDVLPKGELESMSGSGLDQYSHLVRTLSAPMGGNSSGESISIFSSLQVAPFLESRSMGKPKHSQTIARLE